MKKFLTLLVIAFALPMLSKAEGLALKEGDCWTYKTRPGEEQSFLVIRKLETVPGNREIVHISIFGVKVKSPTAPNGYTDTIQHMPISAEALKCFVETKSPKNISRNRLGSRISILVRGPCGSVYGTG